VNQNELLGLRLLSLHNLRFLLELTLGARQAIEGARFAAYKREALARIADAPEEVRCRL
jgi:queuine tRNA-ribosyltransferase